MRARCSNPKSDNYAYYGGRGIKVCDRWISSYENFLADMGIRPKGHTLEREDVNGNYDPGNCSWLDQKKQARNTRTSSLYTMNGETLCLAEWVERFNAKYSMVHLRLQRGYGIREALQAPARITKTLTFDGRTLSLRDWAKETGISVSTLEKRVRVGWRVERTLSTKRWPKRR
jgi:hypothetical protein